MDDRITELDDKEVATLKTLSGQALQKMQEARLKAEGTPLDSVERLDLAAVERSYDAAKKAYDTAINERNHAEQRLKELQQPQNKRIRLIRETESSYPKFAYDLSHATIHSVQDDEGNTLRYMKLGNNGTWWAEQPTPYPMYIRDFYDDLYTRTKTAISEKHSLGFLCTGTPGIGKSLGGLYVAMKLFQDGGLVYYQYKSAEIIVFVGATALDDVRKLNIGITEVGAYTCPPELQVTILRVPGCVRVWDPQHEEKVFSSSTFTLVVSSPDEQKLSDFGKTPGTIEWWAPLWTLEELHKAAFVMRHEGVNHLTNVGTDPVISVPLTDELVASRFDIFGGCARPIFDLRFDVKLNEALNRAGHESIKSLYFGHEGEDCRKGDLSHLLVHRHPKPGTNYAVPTIDVASAHIGRILFDRL